MSSDDGPPSTSTRGPYNCLKVIGAGAFGKVFQAKHAGTGTVVALKVIDLENSDHEDIALIQKEVAVLSQLSNVPNITKYYGSFLDGSEVCIAMEYASAGSVYDLMQTLPSRCLDEKPAAFIIREILIALVALHAVPVIHRDIKCANILVTKIGGVMLCDFGVAALLQGTNNRRDTWIGSPYWMAPEIVSGSSSYDVKVDIWSLGVTLYEMIKGTPPLAHLRPEDALKRIGKSQPPRLGEEDSSTLMRTFLASCLKENPVERPSADMLVKDKWIVKLKVSNTLLKDLIPSYRQSLPNLDAANDSYSGFFVRPESWSFGNEEEDELAFDNATVHPISTPLPRSLKGLFDDFRTPMNQPYSDDNYKSLAIPTSLHTTVPDSLAFPSSPHLPSSTNYTPTPVSAPLATTDPLNTPHSPLPPSGNFTPNHLPEEHLSSASSTSSTLTRIPLDIPPAIQTRRSPVSSSSPEASSSEGSQPPPGPSTRSMHFNNDPPSSSTSSAFKVTHRMQTITGKSIRRDDSSGPLWKFPAALISSSNSRGPEMVNVGLGLAVPSPALAQQLGMPDLLPPSPLPLGYTHAKMSVEDLHPPTILPATSETTAPTFILSHTPPRSVNYPALISDSNLMNKEFDRVVRDLTGLLQDVYEGLNDLLGDDPIEE